MPCNAKLHPLPCLRDRVRLQDKAARASVQDRWQSPASSSPPPDPDDRDAVPAARDPLEDSCPSECRGATPQSGRKLHRSAYVQPKSAAEPAVAQDRPDSTVSPFSTRLRLVGDGHPPALDALGASARNCQTSRATQPAADRSHFQSGARGSGAPGQPSPRQEAATRPQPVDHGHAQYFLKSTPMPLRTRLPPQRQHQPGDLAN